MVARRYPYIETIGLKITPAKVPYVTWAHIRKGLGQWRYSAALRLGFADLPKRGVPADVLERILARMAQCARTWPPYWRPKQRAE